MGKRILCTGIIIGAVIGGLTALIDRDARGYVKEKSSVLRLKTSYYVRNPSVAVHNMRSSVDQLNKSLTSGAEGTINALEQLEKTLEKISTKDSQVKLLK